MLQAEIARLRRQLDPGGTASEQDRSSSEHHGKSTDVLGQHLRERGQAADVETVMTAPITRCGCTSHTGPRAATLPRTAWWTRVP